MRKPLSLGLLFLAVSISAAAQDYPKAEVFGSYSYFHSSFAGTGLNFNGTSSAITVNPSPWFGVTGDFGVYHRSDSGLSSNNLTYLFGPQFTYRANQHATPFFHILFGGSHLSSSFSSGGTSSSGSSNAFAMGFGGGLDAKVSPHIAIRVAQVDYLLTKFQDDQDNRQNNVRVSAGIVFRWGGTTGGK
jgi:opacity protein-like surface antigen